MKLAEYIKKFFTKDEDTGIAVPEVSDPELYIGDDMPEELYDESEIGRGISYDDELFEKDIGDFRFEKPIITKALRLPEGWYWEDFADGSGGLNSPDGTGYFTYDRATGEYDIYGNRDWRFWGGSMPLSEFKEYAENYISSHVLKNTDCREQAQDVKIQKSKSHGRRM